MLVMRMSRHGTKKRPFYHIVVADSRYPRDGRFIEKIGTFNPMLASDNPQRVQLVEERVKHWIKNGAQPSDRVVNSNRRSCSHYLADVVVCVKIGRGRVR